MTTILGRGTLAVLGLCGALALGGCGGGASLTNPGEWFSNLGSTSKASNSSGADAGFTVSRSATDRLSPGPAPASELVAADGTCTGVAAGPAPGTVPAGAAVVAGPTLDMTECQLVGIAGPPDRVDIGANAGERRLVMTYTKGNHPGVYTFEAGRLKLINAAEAPPKPAPKQRARSRRRS